MSKDNKYDYNLCYTAYGILRLCGGKPLGGLFSLRASRRGPLVFSAGVFFVIVVLFVQVCRCLYRHAAMQVGLGSGQLSR